MPLNSWTCLFFSGFRFESPKKDYYLLYFTIHTFGWDYSRILRSSLQSLQDHNGGHGWKNRTNGEARLYKLLTKIRKSSTSLQFRLGWKTLEKTAKTYYSSSRRSRSQSEQPRCISSLAKKQPLKHKNDRPKKRNNYLLYPKTKWRHTKRNYTLCIARILYPAIIIDRNHVNFQNDRPKN